MKRNMTFGILLAGLLLLGGGYYLRAQMDTNMDDPRPQGQGPMGGMNRPMMGMMPGMTGGGAMVVFEKHIYVLSGPTLYKINPAEMKVVAELRLRKPPAGRPGRQDDMGGPDAMGGQ